MKGLTNVCCCCSCPSEAKSVQLLCGCLISMCRDCCMDQFAHKPTTFRSHITCPVCGDQSTSAYIGMIEGVKEAEQREKELIKSACKHFEERPPFSYQKNVVKRLLPKLLVLVEKFSELGYPEPNECDEPVSNRVVNPILLHVARCEAWRQEAVAATGSDRCPDPNAKLPLGPLELVSVKANHTLEKVLDIVLGRDEVNHIQQACCNCHEQLVAGTTVLTLCSCYTFGCQLCQRRIMKNYKNTYRDSPVKCLMCNSRSVPIDNIPAAKTLEWTLLKQHPRYRSGNLRTEELYCIYADIAQACRMERAIDFHDFIEPASAERGIGSNNLHTKPMCLLEMARMEAERQRRDYFCVPVEQASDVSELPLGPLNRIRIRRDVALEAFLTFLNGPADGQPPAARTDSGNAQVLEDPESLFDEVTNTVRELDAPGGDLSPEVCKTVATEILFEERRAAAQDEARAKGKVKSTRNLRLLLRNYYTPCPYEGCAVNPSCPVYLEQHIRIHHLEPVPEPVAPITAAAASARASRRGRGRSAEEANSSSGLLAASRGSEGGSAGGVEGEGEGEGEEDFDEEDLSRAMAASLATYRTEVEASTASARRTASQVPLMRLEGHRAQSQSDSEPEAEEGASKQRVGPKDRKAAHRAKADLPQHSLLQGVPAAVDGEDAGPAVTKPPRQRRRIAVEEDDEVQWEEEPVGRAERSSSSSSAAWPHRDREQQQHWEDVGELWEPSSLVPAGALDAAAPRPTDSGTAPTVASTQQRSAGTKLSTISSTAGTTAAGAQRIKKRKAAFQEADSSEDEGLRPGAVVRKAQASQRPSDPRKPAQQPSPRVTPGAAQAVKKPPSQQSTAGFFTEFISRSAVSTTPSDRPAVTAPSAPFIALPSVGAESAAHTADAVAKTVAPVEAQMHALRRRREIMIQANSAHEQAERLGVLRDRQRKPAGARAVRFAPHVDQFMFVQVDSENEVEPWPGEDNSSGGSSAEEKSLVGPSSQAYSQREADISPPVIKVERPPPPPGPPPSGPPRPRAVDYFTIVDRHHVSAPEQMLLESDAPVVGHSEDNPPPPARPPPPPPRPPVSTLTPERQAVLDRLTSLHPAESPMPASTTESSSESEDDDAPPPQLPYVQFRQPSTAAGDRAETKPTTGTGTAATATRRIDNATSQYAYPRASMEASESREEYLRQSVARYSQEAYRSEEADRERARKASQYPRYGMPYMEDTRRFSEEVVRNPDDVWRSGEAYVNLPNAATRRYEMVFEEGKAVDDRLPCSLTTRVEYWLKYPEGALKEQPDAQPSSERGYQRVKIHIETTRSELVAVLKLILLPKYGFRGKVAEWMSKTGGYLQCKGTFYKYNILPGSTITLRDLNRNPANRYALQARGVSLGGKDVDDDDAPRYYGWKRKNPHRLSNAQFAMRSVEMRMQRQLEQQQAEEEERRRQESTSGSDAAAGPASEMVVVEERAEVEAELDRWLEHDQEPACMMASEKQGGSSMAGSSNGNGRSVPRRPASPEEGMTSTDTEDGEESDRHGVASVTDGEDVLGQLTLAVAGPAEVLKAGHGAHPSQASAPDTSAMDCSDGCPVGNIMPPGGADAGTSLSYAGSSITTADKAVACASAAVAAPATALPLLLLDAQGPGAAAMEATESDSGSATVVNLPAVILLPDASAVPLVLDSTDAQPRTDMKTDRPVADDSYSMLLAPPNEHHTDPDLPNEVEAGDGTAASSGDETEDEEDGARWSLAAAAKRSKQPVLALQEVMEASDAGAAGTETMKIGRQLQEEGRAHRAREEDEDDSEEAWSLAAVAARLRRTAPAETEQRAADVMAGPSVPPSGAATAVPASVAQVAPADPPRISSRKPSRFEEVMPVAPPAQPAPAPEPTSELRTYPRLSQHTPLPVAVAPSQSPAAPTSVPSAAQRPKPSRPRFGSSDEVSNPMEALLPVDPDLEPYKRQKLTSESLRTLQSTLPPDTLRGRSPPRPSSSPPRSKYGPALELPTRRPFNPQVEALGGYSNMPVVQPPIPQGTTGYSHSSNASAADANKGKSRFGSAEINFEYNELDDETSSDDGEPNPTRKRKGGLRKPKLPLAQQTTGSTNAEGISRKRPPIYFDTSVRFAVAAPPSGDTMAPVDLNALLQGNSDEDELGRRRRDAGSDRGKSRGVGDSRRDDDRDRGWDRDRNRDRERFREGERAGRGDWDRGSRNRDEDRDRGRQREGERNGDDRGGSTGEDRYGDNRGRRSSRDSRERGNGGSRRPDRDRDRGEYSSKERRRRSPSPSPPPSRPRQRVDEAPVGWGLDRSAAAVTPATTSPSTFVPTPRLVTRTRQYKDNWGAIHLIEEVVEEAPPPPQRTIAPATALSHYGPGSTAPATSVLSGGTAQYPFDMTADTPEEADLQRRMLERLAAVQAARANLDQRGGGGGSGGGPINPNPFGRR